jgi:hypothetical protein
VVNERIQQSGPCEQCGLEESGYYDDRDRVELRKAVAKVKELEDLREKARLMHDRNAKFLLQINHLLGHPEIHLNSDQDILDYMVGLLKEKLDVKDPHP